MKSDSRFRAACVQLRSSDDAAENVREASAWIREAAAAGAEFVATPENTTLMAPDGGAKLELSHTENLDPALPAFRALAQELSIWLLIGSLPIRVSATKTANRSFLINPGGTITARYDKIFLFDVDLPSGEQYRESNTVRQSPAADDPGHPECRQSPSARDTPSRKHCRSPATPLREKRAATLPWST